MDNYLVTLLNKNSVSAVFASAHNEIGCNRFFAVAGFADNDSSAYIGIVFDDFADS